MSKVKNLFKGQKLSFDNHHSGTVMKWNDQLHFHKSMNIRGGKRSITGCFYTQGGRMDVAYETSPKNHTPIKNKKERNNYLSEIKTEIKKALQDPEGAKKFYINIKKGLESIFGNNIGEKPRDALSSIMKAVGFNPDDEIEIALQKIMDAVGFDSKNSVTYNEGNDKTLLLYLDEVTENKTDVINTQFNAICNFKHSSRFKSFYYYWKEIKYHVYYIYVQKRTKSIRMGELDPRTCAYLQRNGFYNPLKSNSQN